MKTISKLLTILSILLIGISGLIADRFAEDINHGIRDDIYSGNLINEDVMDEDLPGYNDVYNTGVHMISTPLEDLEISGSGDEFYEGATVDTVGYGYDKWDQNRAYRQDTIRGAEHMNRSMEGVNRGAGMRGMGHGGGRR